MHTIKELSKNINKTVSYRIGALIFDVIILDVKTSYGNIRFEITPTAGCGIQWVNSDSITFQNDRG